MLNYFHRGITLNFIIAHLNACSRFVSLHKIWLVFSCSSISVVLLHDLSFSGPEQELLQLPVFGELRALFPGVQVHMEIIGPEIPAHRSVVNWFCSSQRGVKSKSSVCLVVYIIHIMER